MTRVRRHPWVPDFVLVGGRTTTTMRILLHTQVSVPVSRPAQAAGPQPEAVALFSAAAAGPVSVAELSASTRIPLGVVRILLSDLAGRGLVTLHAEPDPFSTELLERVLEGLRAL